MLPPGKLSHEILDSLLRHLPANDPRVIIGPAVGDDAAIIESGDNYLLVTADPITFVAENIGWYAVAINVNDIAVMGGTPKWFTPIILLPEKMPDTEIIEQLFAEIGRACKDFGVSAIGGHTEIMPGLDRPVIAGQMIGEVGKPDLIDKRNIKPGDSIYLAGGIAIEAVSIIAREKQELLLQHVTESFLREAMEYIHSPGICVLNLAEAAARTGSVTGMHDPTEGGLEGGLWEMAERSGTGFEVNGDSVPVLEHCRELCAIFRLNPFRLIASGALLITVRSGEEKEFESSFDSSVVKPVKIGEVLEDKTNRIIRKNAYTFPVQPPFVDEIHKIWD